MTSQNSKELSINVVRSLLKYDPQTGKWKWLASGKDAGCRRADGYVLIGIRGYIAKPRKATHEG